MGCVGGNGPQDSADFKLETRKHALYGSPASSSWRHSNVTSNVKGFVKAVGLSSTTTLVTLTRAIAPRAPGGLRGTWALGVRLNLKNGTPGSSCVGGDPRQRMSMKWMMSRSKVDAVPMVTLSKVSQEMNVPKRYTLPMLSSEDVVRGPFCNVHLLRLKPQ